MSWGEEEPRFQSKPMLTQSLPPEDSEDEIPEVHAETDAPACVRLNPPPHPHYGFQESRAARNDSASGTRNETGRRKCLFLACQKCPCCGPPSSSSSVCGSCSQDLYCGGASPVAGDSPWWERSLPGPISQQSPPIHGEKRLLFCTPLRDHLRFLILPHCGFTPSLWGRSYFFWERVGPVFLPLLPFPSSAT